MDICIVSGETSTTPPTVGDQLSSWSESEQVSWELACALSRLGHKITLVARTGSKKPPSGVLIETYESVDSTVDVCALHYNLYKEHVYKFKGIVHDNSIGKLARTVSRYYLQTPHYCQDPRGMGFQNIIAISRAQALWMRQYIPNGKIPPIIYHGIDLDRYPYNETKEDYYLFCSVLSEYKGALTALDIAKKTGVEMIFIGAPGGVQHIIEDATKYYSNIKYHGNVNQTEKQVLMANAKALVYPTGNFGEINTPGLADWIETFGLEQLEALSSGTPVIASNNGACPELIKHGRTGLICLSKEDMALKIQSNSIDTIDPRICRDDAESRFSSKRMAEDYLKYYEMVLDGKLV